MDIALRDNKPKIEIKAQTIRRTMCSFLLSKWKYRFMSLDPYTFTDICHLSRTQALQIESFQCTERPVWSNRMKHCQQNKTHPHWSDLECFEYSSFQTNHQYFFLKHDVNMTIVDSVVVYQSHRFWSKAQLSWRMAQRECNNIGRSLIYFLSKTDLTDILQFVKFMKLQTGLMNDPEALYIGLKFEVCLLIFTKYACAFFHLTMVK